MPTLPSVPPTCLNLDELRKRLHAALDPSLLHPRYRAQWTKENPTFGMCSVASEAAWFMLGGSAKGWHAYVTQDPWSGGTHWWLEHRSGLRFDPTEEQYLTQGQQPPYHRGLPGKPCGFMGIRVDPNSPWGFDRKPSTRAQALIDTMRALSPDSSSAKTVSRQGLNP